MGYNNQLVLELDDDDLDLVRFILDDTIDRWTDEEEKVVMSVATDPDHQTIEDAQQAAADIVGMRLRAKRIREMMVPKRREEVAS